LAAAWPFCPASSASGSNNNCRSAAGTCGDTGQSGTGTRSGGAIQADTRTATSRPDSSDHAAFPQ
jgi:hypothetical protein